MSRPIAICALYAATRDEAAFHTLHRVWRANIRSGHFTLVGCPHDPPCRPPAARQLDALLDRLSGTASDPPDEDKLRAIPRSNR